MDRDIGRLPSWVWVGGLICSGIFCTAVLTPMLKMKVYEPIAAVVLALLIAILAVRALGETDLVCPLLMSAFNLQTKVLHFRPQG